MDPNVGNYVKLQLNQERRSFIESLRSKYPPSFNAKAALEGIKEEKTSAELSSQYQVHPARIRN